MAVWPGANNGLVTASGTYTWVAPAGVTNLEVDLWGSGGGGGGGVQIDGFGGSGGGGGGYSQTTFTNIVPGNTYNIIIANGGTAGSTFGGAGGDGAASTWQTTGVVANGGKGGGGDGGTAGAGGVLGTGTTKHSGGSGATTPGTQGYAGGGSGGSTGNGGNASGTTGGIAGTGSPNGAAGGNSNTAGTTKGGGGGGAPASGSGAGKAGADGSGILSWPTVFTVTFNANGGSGSMSAEQNNQAANLTANAFTRTGYTYSNWNTGPGGGGTTYADGASYAFTASVTLYAQWTINTYDVIFNNNGGTGTMANETQNYNTTAALTTNTFTRTGYNFSGWNTAANGSGTAYADGANFTWPANNTTLYAQWSVVGTTSQFRALMGVGI